jgi:protein-disulfide isomerase
MTSPTLATPITDDDHTQGPADAAVTLVLYGDYECPYTRLSMHSVHQLRREYHDGLRFVSRNFPLEEIHPHARVAAAAAEAAGLQTDFWTMHDYLFAHQKALEDADLKRYAGAVGLDPDRFDRDRSSSSVELRVDRDLSNGTRSGVPGTPTFYLNGIRHDGGYDLESLRLAIVARLDRSPESHRLRRHGAPRIPPSATQHGPTPDHWSGGVYTKLDLQYFR